MIIKPNSIHVGNVLSVIKNWDSQQFDMLITSPPYWACRDYETTPVDWKDWIGELGQEPDPNLYIKHLGDTIEGCAKLIKPTGSIWVNIGDNFYGHPNDRSHKNKDGTKLPIINKTNENIDERSLVGLPFLFALDMIRRGFILRNTIIWHKPNCRPISTKNRFTIDFEYVFFFVTQSDYFFNMQYEPLMQPRAHGIVFGGQKALGYKKGYFGSEYNATKLQGRHKRCVWSIMTSNLRESHYAPFPEALCHPMISAGCPKGGIVLDPFLGSGTSARVSLMQKKRFVGIDIKKEYATIAYRRIQPLIRQKELT